MSQQHRLPGPPPTPGWAESVPDGFYVQRRCPLPAQPPSITTNFLGVQGGSPLSQTPMSSGDATPFPFSPSTPVVLNLRPASALHLTSQASVSRSPNPAMEPYNPRQWSQTRQVSGSQMVFGRGSNMPSSTRETTGMEGESMLLSSIAADESFAFCEDYVAVALLCQV